MGTNVGQQWFKRLDACWQGYAVGTAVELLAHQDLGAWAKGLRRGKKLTVHSERENGPHFVYTCRQSPGRALGTPDSHPLFSTWTVMGTTVRNYLGWRGLSGKARQGRSTLHLSVCTQKMNKYSQCYINTPLRNQVAYGILVSERLFLYLHLSRGLLSVNKPKTVRSQNRCEHSLFFFLMW